MPPSEVEDVYYPPNQVEKETTAIGSKSVWILTLTFQSWKRKKLVLEKKPWISCLGLPPVSSLPFPAFPCARWLPPSAPAVLAFACCRSRAWVVQIAASVPAVSWFLPHHVCTEKEKGVLGVFKEPWQRLLFEHLLSQLHWFFMHVTSVWERYRQKLPSDSLVPGSSVCLTDWVAFGICTHRLTDSESMMLFLVWICS